MIRKMTAADAEAIERVLGESSQASQRFTGQPSIVSPGTHIWVAEQGGEVIGMVAARTVADEAEILNLAIVPAWRRHGVGRSLMEAAIAASSAAGAHCVFLEVRESNAAARAFYARMKFAEAGRRRGYYRDPPEDALILSLTLPSGRSKSLVGGD